MFFVSPRIKNGRVRRCISGPLGDNLREPERSLGLAEVKVRRGGTEVAGGSEEEPEVKAGRGWGVEGKASQKVLRPLLVVSRRCRASGTRRYRGGCCGCLRPGGTEVVAVAARDLVTAS